MSLASRVQASILSWVFSLQPQPEHIKHSRFLHFLESQLLATIPGTSLGIIQGSLVKATVSTLNDIGLEKKIIKIYCTSHRIFRKAEEQALGIYDQKHVWHQVVELLVGMPQPRWLNQRLNRAPHRSPAWILNAALSTTASAAPPLHPEIITPLKENLHSLCKSNRCLKFVNPHDFLKNLKIDLVKRSEIYLSHRLTKWRNPLKLATAFTCNTEQI